MRNILLIVEGRKTEPKFFKQLRIIYGIDYKIFCLSTNIYTLYSRIKDLDFNCDIKNVLKELHPEQGRILNNKFAYTYLIFSGDGASYDDYSDSSYSDFSWYLDLKDDNI